MLESWDKGSAQGNCTIRAAKTNALISFTVTEKLVCAFFAYVDCWFSDAAAKILNKQRWGNHSAFLQAGMISVSWKPAEC